LLAYLSLHGGVGRYAAGVQKILMASLMGVCSALGAPPEAREWTAPDGTVVKYRWSAPATMEPGKTYPLVLFLHGAGERVLRVA